MTIQEVFPELHSIPRVTLTLFYHHYKSILQRIRIGEDVTEHVKVIGDRYPEIVNLICLNNMNYTVTKSNGDE
jgi:hypothetical protein